MIMCSCSVCVCVCVCVSTMSCVYHVVFCCESFQDVARYKRLDHRSQLRQSQALKHIGSLQMPGKARVYGKSGLQDVIEEYEAAGKLE